MLLRHDTLNSRSAMLVCWHEEKGWSMANPERLDYRNHRSKADFREKKNNRSNFSIYQFLNPTVITNTFVE